jgi:hypothetical protein
MLRRSLRGLAAVGVAAFALGPAPAAAVTPVSDCADLTKAGETYVVTANVTALPDGLCFLILADRITLDLAGHTITGPASGAGVIDGAALTSTVVKNGTITGSFIAIDLRFSSRSTVRAVTASNNIDTAMEIGPNSLVKDCVVQRNGSHGIRASDQVQIENCVVGDAEPGAGVDGNGGFGIVGGQRVLVTRTTANGNGGTGIVLGMRSTVSHSTASFNGNDGIAVGQGSLVTRNTADHNDGDGIEAVCPSTITHNTTGANGLDINLIGTGCVDLHNVRTPPAP